MFSLPNNLLVVDIETSGINPFKNQILSIGLVPLSKDISPCLVYIRSDEINWSSYARSNFEKFSDDWSSQALTAIRAANVIEQYVADKFGGEVATVIGHNIGFDVAFLRKLAFDAGKDELVGISHRMIDTHTLLYLLYLKGKLPQSALRSDGAFNYFNINIDESERHTALGDAFATRELLLKIFDMLDIQKI